MNRLGLIHPGTMVGRPNHETRVAYSAFVNNVNADQQAAFTVTLPLTGALIGAPGILMHTPELARTFLSFERAMRNLPGLEERVREIAILVVAIHEQAGYEIYAHERVAISNGLLTRVEIDGLHDGSCPGSFSLAERIAQTVTGDLCSAIGPLRSETWAEAVNTLGRDAAVALVHTVGLCRYIATILNGFDAQVPAEGERAESSQY